MIKPLYKYRFDTEDAWLMCTHKVKYSTPYLAWSKAPFGLRHCYVYEGDELVAIIDCTGWAKTKWNGDAFEQFFHVINTGLARLQRQDEMR